MHPQRIRCSTPRGRGVLARVRRVETNDDITGPWRRFYVEWGGCEFVVDEPDVEIPDNRHRPTPITTNE